MSTTCHQSCSHLLNREEVETSKVKSQAWERLNYLYLDPCQECFHFELSSRQIYQNQLQTWMSISHHEWKSLGEQFLRSYPFSSFRIHIRIIQVSHNHLLQSYRDGHFLLKLVCEFLRKILQQLSYFEERLLLLGRVDMACYQCSLGDLLYRQDQVSHM